MLTGKVQPYKLNHHGFWNALPCDVLWQTDGRLLYSCWCVWLVRSKCSLSKCVCPYREAQQSGADKAWCLTGSVTACFCPDLQLCLRGSMMLLQHLMYWLSHWLSNVKNRFGVYLYCMRCTQLIHVSTLPTTVDLCLGYWWPHTENCRHNDFIQQKF